MRQFSECVCVAATAAHTRPIVHLTVLFALAHFIIFAVATPSAATARGSAHQHICTLSESSLFHYITHKFIAYEFSAQ